MLEHTGADPQQRCGEVSLGDALLAPTTIYNRPLLALQRTFINGAYHRRRHSENLPGYYPKSGRARPSRQLVTAPVFEWCRWRQYRRAEMRTFNCGVGMILVVAAEHTAETLSQLNHWPVGLGAGEISEDAGVTFC